MNFIQVLFSLMTTAIIIAGTLINLLEHRLPTFISQNFRYGKFASKAKPSLLAIEVPKCWFRHFYVLAVLIYSYGLYLVTSVYVFNHNVPQFVENFLNLTCGENRIAFTSATTVYLAILLLSLQVFRRFYDTHYVSVFGKNSRINLSHYLIGMIHYPATLIAVLCEAPHFANFTAEATETSLNFSSLTYSNIFFSLVFIWAWWHQHTCSKILAGLRKNKKGQIVTDDHKLPMGDWFQYLSAPHQTAEILMYFCINMLLWQNITWFFVFGWVLSNQVETILLSHWWYQETFDEFPNERKALIPFVY